MQNPKTGGSRWVPDIRPENIDTYTEQDGEQNAQYKIVDAHPIIGGVLDKLAFFRTHASAVWYNKLKNITVLQKLDNLASNIGVLSQLATTDKSSLVNALNELNGKMNYRFFQIVDLADTNGKQIQIPANVSSVLIFAGCPNPDSTIQVYGGKSYIIPRIERGTNIIYEKDFNWPNTGDRKCGNFYAMWNNDGVLILDSQSPAVRVRIYVK